MAFDIAIIVTLGIVAFILAFMSFKFNQRTHGAIALLFMMFSLFIIVILLNIPLTFIDVIEFQNVSSWNDTATNTIVENTTVSYSYPTPMTNMITSAANAILYLIYFTIAYFIIIFIYNVLVNLGKIKAFNFSLFKGKSVSDEEEE